MTSETSKATPRKKPAAKGKPAAKAGPKGKGKKGKGKPISASRKKALDWARGLFGRVDLCKSFNRREKAAALEILMEMSVCFNGRRKNSTELPAALGDVSASVSDVAWALAKHVGQVLDVPVPHGSEVLERFPADAPAEAAVVPTTTAPEVSLENVVAEEDAAGSSGVTSCCVPAASAIVPTTTEPIETQTSDAPAEGPAAPELPPVETAVADPMPVEMSGVDMPSVDAAVVDVTP